jgi:hypothetical protein
MFRRGFFGAILALVLIIGLVGLVGNAVYRSGYADGYTAGQVADGAEDGDAVPPPGRGYDRYWGFGFFPFLWFAGGFLKFILFLLFFGLIFKLLGFWFWRGRGRGHGPGHWGWHHGPGHPPYGKGGPADEPVMKA